MRFSTAILALFAMTVGGCSRSPVSEDSFTTSQPASADIPGSYSLVSQTVTTNGMSELKGRHCVLNLAADGTFTITNYFPSLIAPTGRWRCETIGFTHGRDMWGIRFDSIPQIEAAALTGASAPYRLVMIFGDPDSHQTMIYEKKK